MKRANLLSADVGAMQARCITLGVSFRIATDAAGDCRLIVNRVAHDTLEQAESAVQDLRSADSLPLDKSP